MQHKEQYIAPVIETMPIAIETVLLVGSKDQEEAGWDEQLSKRKRFEEYSTPQELNKSYNAWED